MNFSSFKKTTIKTVLALTAFAIFTAAAFIGCNGKSGSQKGSADNSKGLSYYNKKQYNSAIKSFESAIAANKTNPDFYVNLGMTYIETGNYNEAITQFELALKLSPEHRLAKRGLGIVKLATGEYEEAISLFTDVLLSAKIVSSLELDLLDYRAVAETKLLRYDAAIQTYTSLIDVGYKTKEHLYQRGHLYLLNGDYDAAIIDFSEAVNNSDFDCSTYLNIYHALDFAGYNDEAVNFLGKALSSPAIKNSDDFSLALIYYYLGDYTNAAMKFNSTIPKETESLLYLGKIYMAQANMAQAKSEFLEYLNYDNSNGEVYNLLGLISIEENDYTAALDFFKNGVLTKDTAVMKDLKWNEAVCYEYLGDFDTARAKVAEFLEIYPNDAAALREYDFLKTR